MSASIECKYTPADISVNFMADPLIVSTGSQIIRPDEYSGPYSVTPNDQQQTLETANKMLMQNIVVAAAPSDWMFRASGEITVSTSSTTATSVKIITQSGQIKAGDVYWVSIRDKAGRRSGYFYGSDSICISTQDDHTNQSVHYYYGTVSQGIGKYGVYCSDISKYSGTSLTKKYAIYLSSKYSSSYSQTINGTFEYKVYKLKNPLVF